MSPTLPQQRARETRQQILAAAHRVFVRRGYAAATVSNIAAEAGISMGALYHHFASKEELFRAVVDDHLRADFREIASLAPATSFRELLERLIVFWLEHVRAHREFNALFMELCAHATREQWARASVAGFIQLGRGLIREILQLGRDVGVVRPDLDIEAAALLVYATLQGNTVERAIEPEGAEPAGLVACWVDLIERFVGADGGADIGALQSRLASWIEEVADRHATLQDSSTSRVAVNR